MYTLRSSSAATWRYVAQSLCSSAAAACFDTLHSLTETTCVIVLALFGVVIQQGVTLRDATTTTTTTRNLQSVYPVAERAVHYERTEHIHVDRNADCH